MAISGLNFSSMRATGRQAGGSGGVGSDGSKWSKFQNRSKKMGLDERFRMVRVSCHLEVVVKSYGQNTVSMSRNKKLQI